MIIHVIHALYAEMFGLQGQGHDYAMISCK